MRHVLHIGRHPAINEEKKAELVRVCGNVRIVHVDAGDEPNVQKALSANNWAAVYAKGCGPMIREALEKAKPPLLIDIKQTKTGLNARQGGFNDIFVGFGVADGGIVRVLNDGELA
jgi:hypothetical protein